MKLLWLLVLGLALSPGLVRAADPTSASTAPAANATNTAAADATWADIVKNSQPPVPPAEWNTKRPSPEEESAFKRKAGDAAGALADRIKKFYESYPDHPKAAEARQKEKSFRQYAIALHDDPKPVDNGGKAGDAANKPAAPVEEIDPAYKVAYFEAMARIKDARQNGPPAVVAELEKSGRALASKWPKRPEPWDMLLTAAQYAEPTRSLDIYKEVAANAPGAEMRAFGAAEVKVLDHLNKPITLAFKAIDDRPVDLAKLKGKVVLIDFWATWCPGCVAEMPAVLKTYRELHEKGFEIVGVSFDDDPDEMKRFITANDIPWAQFCDGLGSKSPINSDFGVHALPTMMIVDKKGIVRDMRGYENLDGKVRNLLKETD
jgi:thiol-disulfide isomerase/thioredoxin